ncbi:MAG: DUF4097 family beta strand repeat-containing protein [Clostridium sp.]
MSTKKKILIVALSLLVIGGAFAITGYLMGAKLSINNRTFGIGIFNHKDNASNNISTKKYKLNEFNEMDLDIDMATVNIENGDTYEIEVSYNTRYSEIKHEIKDKKLIVTEQSKGTKIGNKKLKNHITIRIPKNHSFNKSNINLAMGDLNINNLTSKDMDVELDMGSFTGSNIETDNIKCEASMGSIDISKLRSKATNIDVEMGSANISGEIYGVTEINSSMGSVELSSSINLDDYEFDLNTGLGSISINNEEINGKYIKKANSKNIIKAKTEMGSIEVNYKK